MVRTEVECGVQNGDEACKMRVKATSGGWDIQRWGRRE